MKLDNLSVKTSKDPKYSKWLRVCYNYARRSKHPSTYNAALLVKDDKIILKGVNVLPEGVSDIKERYQGKYKHLYPNHAERDVIYKAARKGIKTNGLAMVMPWLPCIACANAIITSGIKHLIVHKQMVERTDDNWKKELRQAIKIMKEAKVQLIAYDGVVGAEAYMHRKKWTA